MKLSEAEKLPIGTILRFKPRPIDGCAAKTGALAKYTRLTYSHICQQMLIEVEWIRNGLDCGQMNGGYDCEAFEPIGHSIQTKPCDCPVGIIAKRGCQYLKKADNLGLIHQ